MSTILNFRNCEIGNYNSNCKINTNVVYTENTTVVHNANNIFNRLELIRVEGNVYYDYTGDFEQLKMSLKDVCSIYEINKVFVETDDIIIIHFGAYCIKVFHLGNYNRVVIYPYNSSGVTWQSEIERIVMIFANLGAKNIKGFVYLTCSVGNSSFVFDANQDGIHTKKE